MDSERRFGDRLEAAMRFRGLTESKLAKATHMNRSTINRYISGDRGDRPGFEIVERLADALSIPSGWLGCKDGVATPAGIKFEPRALLEAIESMREELSERTIRAARAAEDLPRPPRGWPHALRRMEELFSTNLTESLTSKGGDSVDRARKLNAGRRDASAAKLNIHSRKKHAP